MEIEYKDTRQIELDQIRALFETVDWQVSRYPQKLVDALKHYSRLYTAWDGNKLVGLICSLDDGGITAYIHYLLVHPEYQRRGIGKTLLHKMLEDYRDYLRIELLADGSAVSYYIGEKFEKIDAVAMCRKNPGF